MANNMDLVPKDALNQLAELDKQLESTRTRMTEILNESLKVSECLSKIGISYKQLKPAIEATEKITEKLNAIDKERQRILDQKEKIQAKITLAYSNEALELEKLRQINQQISVVRRNIIKEQESQSGSTVKLRSQINLLNNSLDNMSSKMRNSDLGKAMVEDVAKLTEEVSKLEQQTGRFGRNVGNYASGFNQLGFSVQQVARELPSLTVSAQQFFLAISNNIPMLADQIKLTQVRNEALRKEGIATVSVFKQVISSILSWQTALVVGITLLTVFGKEIGSFVSGLFESADAMKKLKEEISSATESIYAEKLSVDALFSSLKKTKEGTKEYKEIKDTILSQYGEYLEGLDEETRTLKNQEEAYKAISTAVLQVAKDKAMSQVRSNITDRYAEQLNSTYNTLYDTLDKRAQEFAKGNANREKDLLSFNQKLKDEFRQTGKISKESLDELYRNYPTGSFTSVEGDIINTDDAGAIIRQFKEISNITTKSNEETEEALSRLNSMYGRASEGVSSLVKDQEALLVQARLMPETTEAEITAKNKKIEAINNEISRLQELGKENKKVSGRDTKSPDAEKKASQDLVLFRIQQNADAEKQILSDNKKSYEDRLSALNSYENELVKSIEISRDNQLSDAKLTVSQRKLIEEKATAEITKVRGEGDKLYLDISKDYSQKQINVINTQAQERAKVLSESYEKARVSLAKEYKDGLLSAEEYEARKKEISDKYMNDSFEAEIAILQSTLDIAELTEEQRLEIEKKIGDARAKFNKEVANNIVSEDEKAADKRLKIEEELAKKRKELIKDLVDSTVEMFSVFTDRRLSQLEDESDKNQEWRDSEIEEVERLENAGAISKEEAEARKWQIEEKSKAKEDEINRKKREAQIKQAIFERSLAAGEVVINTASAIMKNTAQLGFIPAIPINALTVALGAIKLATIVAQPLPKYKYGGEHLKDGPAIVGDGGKHELVMLPDGSMFKTPDIDTLVNLPKGSTILPDYNKAIANMTAKDSLPYRDDKPIVIVDNSKQIKLMKQQSKLLKDTNVNMGRMVQISKINHNNSRWN